MLNKNCIIIINSYNLLTLIQAIVSVVLLLLVVILLFIEEYVDQSIISQNEMSFVEVFSPEN